MATTNQDIHLCEPPPDSNAGRLLPITIDHIADHDPERIFAEFLDWSAPGDVYKLRYRTFAKAIDSLAWWTSSTLSELRLPEFSVIAYVGFPDVRYYCMLVAAIKCGYTVSRKKQDSSNGTD